MSWCASVIEMVAYSLARFHAFPREGSYWFVFDLWHSKVTCSVAEVYVLNETIGGEGGCW